MSSGEWYAVRCVLATERNDAASGEPHLQYEERITLWRADRLSDLRRRDVQRFVDQLRATGYSPSTIQTRSTCST